MVGLPRSIALTLLWLLQVCVGQEPTSATLTGLAIQFEGVSALSDDSLASWADTTKEWFEASYAGNYSASLFTRGRRRLQVSGAWDSDPSMVGLVSVTTEYTVTGQTTNDAGATTIFFDQDLTYSTNHTEDSAAAIAKLPFGFESGKEAYSALLETQVVGFELVGAVGTPFSASATNDTSTSTNETTTTDDSGSNSTDSGEGDSETETDSGEDDGGSNAGAIIGGVLGGAYVGLILLCFFRKLVQSHPDTTIEPLVRH